MCKSSINCKKCGEKGHGEKHCYNRKKSFKPHKGKDQKERERDSVALSESELIKLRKPLGED